MAILTIESPTASSPVPPLFRQAFRPFFLLGSGFGLVALWLWVLGFLVGLPFAPVGGGLWWHAHEMLNGFAGAIIAGFLLTAVQNWTNIPGVRGWPLALLVLQWALARVLLAWPIVPAWCTAALDLGFFPAVALVLGRAVIRVRQWRNLVFLPILLLLAAGDLSTWLALWTGDAEWFVRGTRGTLFLIVMLITVLGGRVIPFFTARGTRTDTIEPLPALENGVVISTALTVLIAFADAWQWWGGIPAASVSVIAALAHGARQARWRPLSTGREPLLWSLHLAYAFMLPGFLLAAAWSLHAIASPSPMIHAFTVGLISPLILAMIARVSLGHSGRPLTVAPAMKYAFAAASGAGLSRALLPALGIGNHWLVYVLSAALWSVAFGLFLWNYAGILTRARVDGRMG